MTRAAIIAAMPAELKPLVRGWRHARSNGVDLWNSDNGEWIAACAGAGVAAATRAFAEVEKGGEVEKVVSVGWAGALREELLPGEAYDVSAVIDARTGEQFAVESHPSCKVTNRGSFDSPSLCSGSLRMTERVEDELWLVTSPKVADHAEKQRLASTYEATLVDMEAAAIARLARMRGIPFYCIKGISDGYSDNLPDFNRFISPEGRFRMASFVVFAVLRPWHWRALVRMGENSKKAARAMAVSLLDLLDERGQIRNRNGYPDRKR